MKKMTHLGIVVGCDARSSNFSAITKLRETKIYWIAENGTKFHKRSGRQPGDWPLHKVLTDSIKPLP